MAHTVDFTSVSTAGLESSPVAEALAGLRANEARYFKNKYDHDFAVVPASEAPEIVEWVHGILEDERGLEIASRPLEVTEGKRAVGFKLSDGMEVPEELAAFRFARQRSKLAGTIRGSYFVIKREH